MDIRNYTWINTFESSISTSTENPPPGKNKNVVLIGVLSGSIILSIIGFLGYRRIKTRQGDILNISALQMPN